MRRWRRRDQRRFEKIILQRWANPLELLEMFIVIAEEAGAEYNNFVRETDEIGEPNKFEALSRLHARSCQVAFEVLLLLKNGFADGAHARWRTLHELSVIANFIRDHDDSLAEKYLDHSIIEEYFSAKIYQKHCENLGFSPIPSSEFLSLENSANLLTKKYGDEFRWDNGWASGIIGKKRVRITDIESKVKMDHVRPFYRLACVNVHAGSRGILFRLGLTEEQQNHILLSRQSVFGLTDPGCNTAYSLLISTSSLLTYEPDMDALIVLKILTQLEVELFDAFGNAENS